jgi:hypothetical protein
MARTLPQKLFIREGSIVSIINAPDDYDELLGELPNSVERVNGLDGPCDWIQYFTHKREQVEGAIEDLRNAMREGTLLWISYPKAGKLGTDLNRYKLWALGRQHGLDAVSQVSVDDTWSAIRFKNVE